MKYFLWSFFSFRYFKKGCCLIELQAKVPYVLDGFPDGAEIFANTFDLD